MYVGLTHFSAKRDLSKITKSSFEERFTSPNRLHNLEPFKQLTDHPVPAASFAVTIWELSTDTFSKPSLVHFLEVDYVANHALVRNNKIYICGNSFFEVRELQSAKSLRRVTHNWFAAGHTIYFDDARKSISISCSASDSVLFFEQDTYRFSRAFRMPEALYGHNYDLTLDDDVRAHFIRHDSQLTHLNCCYPLKDGYLVTAFNQGAVGIFDEAGGYKEILRGFHGCHGARTRPGLEGFYFSDSASGCLYEMNWSGKEIRKFSIESIWLHDTQWIAGDMYACSLGDKNRLQLWDIGRGVMMWDLDLSTYGEAPQLLSASE